MIPVGVVAGQGVYGVVVAVLGATEGVLAVVAHGAVDALEYGVALGTDGQHGPRVFALDGEAVVAVRTLYRVAMLHTLIPFFNNDSSNLAITSSASPPCMKSGSTSASNASSMVSTA